MSARLTRRFVPVIVCALIGALVTILPAGAAPAPKASIDLDQCRNGSAASPSNCVDVAGPTGWANGNAGASQAHYVEGHSAAYRAVMKDLPTGTPITLVLGYDVKHSGAHAIDFLTHYDRLEPHAGFGHAGAEDVVPTDGVTGISATVGTFAIPAPSSLGSPTAGQPTAAFNALPSGERLMTLFGGTISAMAYVSEGDLNAAQSETRVSITFTANSPTAVLAWGGHIGTSTDWGVGKSASGVSGSPYHMRLRTWNLGNLGNTDRSLSAGAVSPIIPELPASLTVTKVVVNDDGGQQEADAFALFVGSTSVTSGVATSLPAGPYMVSEGDHDGYVGTITGDCAPNGSITLQPGQTGAQCTITNNDVASTPPPVDPPVTDPPVTDVESQNATVTPQNPPLQVAPVPTPVVPVPVTGSTPVLSGQELPRTGAGLREETLLALALMLAGLSAQALGRRRSGQADV